jgi:hypothetical protein
MNSIINNQTRLLFFGLFVSVMFFSCVKEVMPPKVSDSPSANTLSPDSAAGGQVITLTGSGLADMRSIVFESHSVPASFNPNFNNDGAVIFTVPDTAYGGQQNITFTNSLGKSVTVSFKVIALPTITSASIYEFVNGTQITLTGNNLESVTKVLLAGSTDEATIVSATKSTLVISMPSSSLNRAKLQITNASGTMVTSQEFVSVDNAYKFFTDDFGVNAGVAVDNWSWCGTAVSPDYAILGANSLKATYASGGWAGLSFHLATPISFSDYTFFTMWVKGGTGDVQMNITPDFSLVKTITIPAGVWTYFKLPIAGWLNGVSGDRLTFQIQGPNGGVDENLYFDDILLVK